MVAGEPVVKLVDQWLTRISYIAQIAGVALALFGLFYTVIPLYQKAAVDEQLARREAELKDVEGRLVLARREAYEVRRERNMLALISRSDECSELLVAMGRLAEDVSREMRREIVLTFKVDIRACLIRKVAELRDEKILSLEDIATLEKSADAIGSELMAQREEVAMKIAGLPEAARKDVSLLYPQGTFVQRANEQIDKWDARVPPHLRKDRTEERLIAQIEWTQERMAQDFRSMAMKRIRDGLVPKEWMAEKAPGPEREAK
jgi:hypothetical protein